MLNVEGITKVKRCRHIGPLYIQKPFYPEGLQHPHLYILHPPGGVVSGDDLNIKINVGFNAGCLITTPGASRFYNGATGAPLQKQTVNIDVAKNAHLEWFPMETIIYDGARVELSTKINLASTSSVCVWDICCTGLPASGQGFLDGRLDQKFMVFTERLPVFVDRLNLDENLKTFSASNAGLRGAAVSGFMLLGPMDDGDDKNGMVLSLREVVEKEGLQSAASITELGKFFVGRYLGNSAFDARNIFCRWWEILRPGLLGKQAVWPRIWST